MGGSGGRYFSEYSPEKLQRRVEKAEEQSRDDSYELEADDLLASYLSQFNNRDVDGVNELLEKVKREISDEFEGTVDILFGGSVAKRTYVDGISDIDSLLLLKETVTGGDTPDQVKEVCASRLREVFGRDSVKVGQLAGSSRNRVGRG